MSNRSKLRLLKKISDSNEELDKASFLVAEEDKALINMLTNKYCSLIRKVVEQEKKETNIHHLYPRSRGWTDKRINKRRINKVFHALYHRIFNNSTPLEQIIRVLFENEKVFIEAFRKDILAIINDWGNKCYKEGVIND